MFFFGCFFFFFSNVLSAHLLPCLCADQVSDPNWEGSGRVQVMVSGLIGQKAGAKTYKPRELELVQRFELDVNVSDQTRLPPFRVSAHETRQEQPVSDCPPPRVAG
jgi:hypothetical protein